MAFNVIRHLSQLLPRLYCVALLLLGPVPSAAVEPETAGAPTAGDPVPFLIHISDIHVSQFNNITINKLSTFCRDFLPRVKGHGLVATVLGGDLVDSNVAAWSGQYPGPIAEEWAKLSHVLLTECAPHSPILTVRGNHDSFAVAGYDDEKNHFYRDMVEQLWPKSPELVRGPSGSWMLPVNDYLLIGLDLTPSAGASRHFFGELSEETEAWLEAEWIQKRRDMRTIIVTHYNFGTLEPPSRRRLTRILHEASDVHVLLTGHTHTVMGHWMYAQFEKLLEMEIPDFKFNGVVRLLQLPPPTPESVDPREWRYSIQPDEDLVPTILPPVVRDGGEVFVTVVGARDVDKVEIIGHGHTVDLTRESSDDLVYSGRLDPDVPIEDAIVQLTYNNGDSRVETNLAPLNPRRRLLPLPVQWAFTNMHTAMFLGSAAFWIGNILLAWFLRSTLLRSGKLLCYLLCGIAVFIPVLPWSLAVGYHGCPSIVFGFGIFCLRSPSWMPNDTYAIAFIGLSIKLALCFAVVKSLDAKSRWSFLTIPVLLWGQYFSLRWTVMSYGPYAFLLAPATTLWDTVFWFGILQRYFGLCKPKRVPPSYTPLRLNRFDSSSSSDSSDVVNGMPRRARRRASP
ncbi:hypothetical protein FOZ63_023286 [Perkinsus olseni]|uniref:Calcineurin-like phosphoesterase domain-containing protein n=2 Tax=Perkinsus olseni TaxID=32597 RepID=A0A7J6RV59_PEROL|nr:hypothetical protein FOZ63_023286 [Perkinsus olseni]